MLKPRKGRGAQTNPESRYSSERRETVAEDWCPPPLATTVKAETARSIISTNQSPDIPFEQSINPYRGCEHGCIYCYARPTHAYLDLSPGLDFESRLFAKRNAAQLLEKEINDPRYQCRLIALGTNTDPYQPIEREWRITRAVIEVLLRHKHPLSIVTKSALIERDLDLLAVMAAEDLVEVHLSITTLDHQLARRMEPRASAPLRRLQSIARLKDAGIRVGVMVAPIIPALNDSELETILGRAQEAGADYAGYVLLRLPHEVKELFEQWLRVHVPLRAEHVLHRIRDVRGGRLNDPQFGKRMRGDGVFAQLIRQRFEIAAKRLGLNKSTHRLDVSKFKKSAMASGGQLPLF